MDTRSCLNNSTSGTLLGRRPLRKFPKSGNTHHYNNERGHVTKRSNQKRTTGYVMKMLFTRHLLVVWITLIWYVSIELWDNGGVLADSATSYPECKFLNIYFKFCLHYRSHFRAPPMHARWDVEENAMVHCLLSRSWRI